MPVPAFRPEVQHGAWSSWSLFLGHWLAPFAGLLLASHKEGVFFFLCETGPVRPFSCSDGTRTCALVSLGVFRIFIHFFS